MIADARSGELGRISLTVSYFISVGTNGITEFARVGFYSVTEPRRLARILFGRYFFNLCVRREIFYCLLRPTLVGRVILMERGRDSLKEVIMR